MRRCLAKAAVVLAAVFFSGTAGAAPITGLTVFGDSLVDSGNAQLGALSIPLPDPAPAAAGYFNGRFSNGYNFADLLALQRTGAPATPFLAGGSNFAVGGARATTNADFSPDLAAQLGFWVGATGGIADPNALYLINAGGNDLLAIQDGDLDAPAAGDVGLAIAGAVEFLDTAGARRIVVSNIPGFGPVADTLNAGLGDALASLSLNMATSLRVFDLQGVYEAVFFNPAAVGLPALTLAPSCLEAEMPSPTVDCSAYAFFDPIHPTAQVHAAIAGQLSAAVPVPGAGLMLLAAAGFLVSRAQRP